MIESWTRKCAGEVDKLIFRYGRLDEGEEEREILLVQIRKILNTWCEGVLNMGATPLELWGVRYQLDGETQVWQLPYSKLVELKLDR